MKLRLCSFPLLLAATLAAAETRSLFDGRTLAGWDGNPAAWRVEDGAITGEIKAGEKLARNEFIYWRGEAADFELTLEFRLSGVPSANSGIQFRSRRLPDGHAAGYQADMDLGTTWLGRIYEEHGRALLAERGIRMAIAPDGRRWTEPFPESVDYTKLMRVEGAWNTYRILATGPHMEVWINGTRVAVLEDHDAKSAALNGLIALQLHSGPGPVKVQFRNLQLTSLGRTPTPPTPTLAAGTPPPTASNIGVARRNGDPPLRRTANVDDLTRLRDSPVLWQLQDNPARATPGGNPAAQKLVAGMKLMPGFQAELIAAEPDLHQPVAFAFDERGRIWVAEAMSYPNRQPEGQGKDRLVILEDRDGDGVFETKKVFAENLNLISGLEVGFGGVWVGAAPNLLFIPDRNHDDVPDGPAEVRLDGWGYQDTHETLNSFTWGPDGWLYGCQGVFTHSLVGKPGAPAAERQKIRAGVWRYHPVRQEFEVFAHGGSNQWGIDFNSVGALFMTHCRSFQGGGGTTYVVRNGHYWNQANTDYAPFISNRGADFAPALKNFLLASARYDSGEGGAGKPGTTAVYGGHSHVGTMIYLGDNWPEIYRDRLFTLNLHGHQINHQRNERSGSGYETFHGGYDVMFAPDATFMGVDLQAGPDGAVYVIDWSDTQHCHNPRDEIWDRTNGRLYRIAWADGYQPAKVNLAAAADSALAAYHTHRNEWFVRTARRLLQERAATRPIDAAALQTLREQAAATSAGVTGQLRALWTLHATGNLDATQLATALAHPADVVRAWAVQLGTERSGQTSLGAATLARLAAEDPSAAVRLAVASAAPGLPATERWPVIAALASHGEDATDRYLPKMTWYALAPLVANDLPRALDLATATAMPTLADSILWFAARTAAGRDSLTQRIATAAAPSASRTLRLLAFALESDTGLVAPQAWSTVATRFAKATGAEQSALEQLSVLFGDQATIARVRTRVADRTSPLAERRRALELLRRAADASATGVFIQLLTDADLRGAVIPLLAAADEPAAAAAALLNNFNSFSAAERSAALAALTSRAALARPLLQAVAAGSFARRDLTALHARQLRNLKDPEVSTLLDRVWGRTGESSADAKATIARLRQTFRDAPTWAYELTAGRAVFDRLCASCHAMNGSSAGLGPDLSGTWRNGLDYFLENIVDPNAVVGADFQLHVITRHEGAVVAGLIDRETDTALVVRTVTETVSIPKSAIKSHEVTSQSLMPAGLLEALPEREAIELLNFLTSAPK